MGDIGVAVIGAGFIGPVHVEALRRLGLPVRGILGPIVDRAGVCISGLGQSAAFLRDLLSESRE
jgi:hypothetical protein